jgi:hypothetical protein
MTLEEKLRQRAEMPTRPPTDWAAVRDEWISQVNRLYEQVTSWLQPFRERGYLNIQRSRVSVSEEYIGDYEIDCLEIISGDATIIFEPFGRNVLGAHGRIELYLKGYKLDAWMLLLLSDVDGTLRWEAWKNKVRGPRLSFDKEGLERIMDAWL